MGAYASAEIAVNVKAVFRSALRHGLPVPRPIDKEWGYYMTANHVRIWHEFVCQNVVDNETFLVATILSERAQSYICKQSLSAPRGRGRRDFLRKATKAFRVDFF